MQLWQLLFVIKLRCVKSAMKWRKLNDFTNSKRFLFRSLIINIKEDSASLWHRTWKCTEILHYCGCLPKITISAPEILPSRILTDKCTKQQPADQSWKHATTFSSFNLHMDQKRRPTVMREMLLHKGSSSVLSVHIWLSNMNTTQSFWWKRLCIPRSSGSRRSLSENTEPHMKHRWN